MTSCAPRPTNFAQLVIGQRLVLQLKFIGAGDNGPGFFDVLAVVPAGEFLENETEHGKGRNENYPLTLGKRQNPPRDNFPKYVHAKGSCKFIPSLHAACYSEPSP